GLLPATKLGKNPRVQERTATQSDAGTARDREHPLSIGKRADIAVADDRHALHRLDHSANALQVRSAAESLGARAAMDCHGGQARLLELAREERGAPALIVPPQPHL